MKIGVSGVGRFAGAFIPLFQQHPLVDEVVIADLMPDRLAAMADEYGVTRTLPSHEALCESDVDAIAIFAQRHLHGPLTIQALEAGKHTYCAVPIASTLSEIDQIVRLVEERRLIYSNGETSYYFPQIMYCRDRFRAGDFGEFVYGEGNYLHDMAQGFYAAYQSSGGDAWRTVAGYPPMFYPTHSTSMITSVTGAHMTSVSCLGYVDSSDDGVFGVGKNLWDNPYSSQTALMRTSDGGMARINEFRRVGWRSAWGGNPMSLYGTDACFVESLGGQHFTRGDQLDVQDVSDLLHVEEVDPRASTTDLHEVLQEDFNARYAKIHPIDRLPEIYHSLHNGHRGAHQFLADDFIKAVHTNTLPPTHVWASAEYSAPGLVAHESALAEGTMMEIPHHGKPPADWELLDPYDAM